MNFNEFIAVNPKKVQALKDRMHHLQINLADIQEQFIRGSGRGGQKINKTSNCVMLQYPKLGLTVKNQETRQRSLNRFLALRELVDDIEMRISPQTSERLKEIQRIRKQKDRKKRRALLLPHHF
jgi:protein subunit release factor B